MTSTLFLDHATALGGAEFSLLEVMNGLSAEGRVVHLACPEGEFMENALQLGLDVHSLDFPRLRQSAHFLKTIKETSAEIQSLASELDAKVLVANTVRAALYTMYGASKAKLPWIWYMRDYWLSESRPRFRILDRIGKWILGSRASLVIANSQSVAAGLPVKGKVHVIYNGIDVETYFPGQGRSEFILKFNIPKDAIMVGTAARLRPWKGIDRFIKSIAELIKVDENVYALVVGGDPFDVNDGYIESIFDLTRILGIKDRILFTGHLDDVRPAMAAMDIFVHPGDPEPFGRVNIEAMAMELPVVGYAHGALPEIVIHEGTGLLVSPGDHPALTSAILDLVRSSERRKGMGRAGRSRVERVFNAKSMIASVSAALKEIR